jgi:DNA invertase Pin-like site-specific DNA recombinase
MGGMKYGYARVSTDDQNIRSHHQPEANWICLVLLYT